jgi:hypothetical protein
VTARVDAESGLAHGRSIVGEGRSEDGWEALRGGAINRTIMHRGRPDGVRESRTYGGEITLLDIF